MLDIGLMLESLAMGKFERSKIDGISVVEKSKRLGAVLNRRNGAANNSLLMWFGNMGAGMAREE